MYRGVPRTYIIGHHSRLTTVGRYHVEDRGYRTPCWLWQRYVNEQGYGIMRHNDQAARAHVVYYEAAKGPVPPGLILDHLCRVRACVNPEHLQPVTDAVNARRGAQTKLTAEAVERIRYLRHTCGLTYRELSEQFGVSMGTINSVVNNRTWNAEKLRQRTTKTT